MSKLGLRLGQAEVPGEHGVEPLAVPMTAVAGEVPADEFAAAFELQALLGEELVLFDGGAGIQGQSFEFVLYRL